MERNNQLFLQLLYIFQAAGMQGLGKLMNPVTNKAEVNLAQAQESVQMLEMLKEFTKGNLSKELERSLDMYLTDLRMNYIEEVNKK